MTADKHVLFIATSANAEHGRGGRRRIVDVANQARLRGFSPHLLCFLPFAQVLRGLRFWRSGRASLSAEANSPVSYAPMLPLTRFVLMEQLNLLWCGLVGWRVSLRTGCRLLYGHGTNAAGIALVAKKLRKDARVIADAHGVGSAEYAYATAAPANDKQLRHLQREEQRVLSLADQVVFVSDHMRNYFHEVMRRDFSSARVIPCAVDTASLPAAESRDLLRDKHGLAERFVVAYVGSAVAYQQPRPMVNLFCQIRELIPQAFFLGITQSPEVFRDLLTELRVPEHDYLLTSLPHEQVMEMLQMGDVGLLLREGSLLNQVSSPTKFAEYLLAGLPVLLTKHVGDYGVIAYRKGLGHLVDLDNLHVDQPLLDFLLSIQTHRQDYLKRCRNYAQTDLSWEHYGKVLAKLLEDAASSWRDK